MNNIYREEYFTWQREMGEFGGMADAFKFEQHIKPTDIVLDFGCGGGYLLKNLICARRIGVEINPAAIPIARENGIECFDSLEHITDSSIDIAISNHALEHVKDPYRVLEKIRVKLKPKGLLVLVVPCESTISPYCATDINQHIYTWNPQLLGNLATQSGFKVISVSPLYHKWPIKYLTVQRYLGWSFFHLLANINGKIHPHDFQVKLIAKAQ